MKKKALSALIIAVFAFVLTGQASPQGAGQAIPGNYIVQLEEGVDGASFAQNNGVNAQRIFTKAVNGFSGVLAPGLVKKLESNPDVFSIVPDRVVSVHGKPERPPKPPKDPEPSSNQIIPAGLTRIGAEPGGLDYTGAGVGVAILDTGIDFEHTDLNVSSTCFYSAAEASTCDDFDGHGTHVAGIVAALNNDADTVGVAPDATVYSVRVLDDLGSGADSSVIEGLDWVLQNATTVIPNIKVVNMSLGRTGTIDDNPVMHTAIQNLVTAGITVITSAGNDQYSEVSQNIPAAYPEVIAVASTTAEAGSGPSRGLCAGAAIPADTASFFTTDGVGVLISAPGERLEDVKKNCTVVSEGILSLQNGGGTARKSGTSMSSPYVAGVVALLVEKNPLITPEAVKAAIAGGADQIGAAPLDSPLGSYSFDGVREGVLNAPGALNAAN